MPAWPSFVARRQHVSAHARSDSLLARRRPRAALRPLSSLDVPPPTHHATHLSLLLVGGPHPSRRPPLLQQSLRAESRATFCTSWQYRRCCRRHPSGPTIFKSSLRATAATALCHSAPLLQAQGSRVPPLGQGCSETLSRWGRGSLRTAGQAEPRSSSGVTLSEADLLLPLNSIIIT